MSTDHDYLARRLTECAELVRNRGTFLTGTEQGIVRSALEDAATAVADPVALAAADPAVVEQAASWLHSWAGDRIGHPWSAVGPVRKALLRARAQGVLNIAAHGTPGELPPAPATTTRPSGSEVAP